MPDEPISRSKQTCRGKLLAGEKLVPGRQNRIRRAERQTESGRDLSGHSRRLVAHRCDSIERTVRRQGLNSWRGVFEPHGHGIVAPGVVEHVAAVGRQDQVESHAFRCARKHVHLISGRGGDQEDTLAHSGDAQTMV